MRASALAACLVLAAPAVALDCAPYRVGETVVSEIPVSTFHHRGEIAPPRHMEVRWPREARVLGPSVVDGRAVETDGDQGFVISIDTGAPFTGSGLDPDELKIGTRGVDYYPVYSKLGFYGGAPSQKRALLQRPDGTTYHSSEGYERTGQTLPGGWIGVRYPDAQLGADRNDLFARWNDTGEIDAVLRCKTERNYPNPSCDIEVKEEPLLVTGNFDRDRLPDLPLIERRLREFALCMTALQ